MNNPGPHPDDALLRAFGYRIHSREPGKVPVWELRRTGRLFAQNAALIDVRKKLAREAKTRKRGGLECGGES